MPMPNAIVAQTMGAGSRVNQSWVAFFLSEASPAWNGSARLPAADRKSASSTAVRCLVQYTIAAPPRWWRPRCFSRRARCSCSQTVTTSTCSLRFGRWEERRNRCSSVEIPNDLHTSSATCGVAVAVQARIRSGLASATNSGIRRYDGRKSCPHSEMQWASSMASRLSFGARGPASICRVESFVKLSGAR